MKGRILLYYLLLAPWAVFYFFGPEVLQFLFENFLILATVLFPISDDFVNKAVKKFPEFLLLTLVIVTGLLLMLDFVFFLSNIHPYFSLLLAVPVYFCFKLVSYPWHFIRKGLKKPLSYFKTKDEDNWIILSVLSSLAVLNHFIPFSLPILAPVSSYIIHQNTG